MATILKAADMTLASLKALHGNDICSKDWTVDNGCSIVTQLKVTYLSGNAIRSCYLHVWITKPNGNVTYYKENKAGNFVSILARVRSLDGINIKHGI